MKKFYLFAVALGAAVWVGCSQDEQLNFVEESRFGFTGVMEMAESRTTLGDDYKVNWVTGEDYVSIFEKDDQNTQYVVESISNGVANFKFVDYIEKANPVSLDAYYSVYPYSEDNSIGSDGVISATVPAAIEDYSDKDDAINQALMVAKSTTTDLKYTNAQGILLLRLNAQKPTNYGGIRSIKIASASHNLAGTATMSWENGVEKPEAKIATGTKELIVNLASNLQSDNLPKSTTGDYMEFYIPIVPTTFEKGDATMTITWTNGDTYEKNIGIAFAVNRNTIKPLKHTVGEQNFTGTTEGAESAVSTVDELLAALQKGGSVILQSDIALNGNVEIPAGATSEIDLNGYSLNTAGNTITVKGDLAVLNGTINAQSDGADMAAAFEVKDGGTLNIESNAKITAKKNGTTAVYMTGGELNVIGTIEVEGKENNGVLFMAGTEADINVEGTISVGENAYAINQISGTTNVTVGENGSLGNSMLQAAGTMNLSYACTTLPVVANDGTAVTLNITAVVSEADALKNAVNEAGATKVVLAAGEYDMPDFKELDGVTLIGENRDGTVIKLYTTQSGGDFCLVESTATLENMTIVTEIENWAGFQNAANLTFNRCNFTNNLFLSGNAAFNECHFTVKTNHYNVWAYSSNDRDYTAGFNDCEFDCAGKSIYIDGNESGTITMKFTNCTFNDNGGGATDKAAIETGNTYGAGATYNVEISECKFNGFAEGKNTGSTIWANKNSISAENLNITIDDSNVY